MIVAKHNWFLYPFFVWYGWVRMNVHFKKVHCIGNIENQNRPILLISNHFSWWDGFIIAAINKQKWKKRFHIMMLENQLRKNWFLNYAGVYSVKKNSKSIIESLTYSIGLLQNEHNLVSLFPQGEFKSAYQQPFHFENGLNWILKNINWPVQLVFMANQVEYFDSPKPHLFVHCKEYNSENKSKDEIEKEYNLFFRECYQKNLELKSK